MTHARHGLYFASTRDALGGLLEPERGPGGPWPGVSRASSPSLLSSPAPRRPVPILVYYPWTRSYAGTQARLHKCPARYVELLPPDAITLVSPNVKNLPADVTKAIGDDLRLVQWQWPVGKPLVDGFGDGLYEVRTKYKNVNHRVLFTFENEAIILLHGIIKKTQKTPQATIALARQRQKG
jgi:phage-related protein